MRTVSDFEGKMLKHTERRRKWCVLYKISNPDWITVRMYDLRNILSIEGNYLIVILVSGALFVD
jgi:hypothetical protein